MNQMNISHDPRNSGQQVQQSQPPPQSVHQPPQPVQAPIVSSLHDVPATTTHPHSRHRPPHYSTPAITTNTSNTLRTNLITVPIQETAVVQQPAPIPHEALQPQNYYTQYAAANYAPPPMAHTVALSPTTNLPQHQATNMVHSLPPPTAQALAPPVQQMTHMAPIHNLNIPPPHIATTQPPGSYYAPAPQTYQTAGYSTPAPQFPAPTQQYVPSAAPSAYPTQAPPTAPQQRNPYEYPPNQQTWMGNNHPYYR